ncbi:MAG: hypothetical protein F4175_11475, partial [Gemmatimonadetes bacterium]|nr:hypothetical protein [Gemmatimonadota bacterium]
MAEATVKLMQKENPIYPFSYQLWRNALHLDENLRSSVENIELQTEFILSTTGQWPIVAEKSDDGAWAVYFKDSPDIIAGSNDSLEDALVGLAETVNDDLQDSRENKDNISPYQAKRHHFLRKVF